jgi:hypothetical protein
VKRTLEVTFGGQLRFLQEPIPVVIFSILFYSIGYG